MNGLPIEIVSASAGSGKTYNLAEKLLDSVKTGTEPENILATTFTNKAASELVERVRTELFKNALPESAQRILDGYLGTVNSVCGRLLKEFAFECGLSPVQDVLPEVEGQFIFERAIASVVEEYSPKIEPIAIRFGTIERNINSNSSVSTNPFPSKAEDWRDSIKRIISQARQNNIDSNDLKQSAKQSWETLKKMLGQPIPDRLSDKLDDDLTTAIHTAFHEIKDNGDLTKGTKVVLDKLAVYVRRGVKAEALSWHDWAELSKLEPRKASRESYQQLTDAAQLHFKHPRFHKDLEACINLVFECAAEAMQAFADFKKKQGLIDFVDQEKLTLDLLKKQNIQNWLKQRLELVLVDEFQDTSPIQLALFLELAGLAKNSIWVGDQKQSIYGFRGTDPILMDKVIEKLIRQTHLNILSASHRSRPGLVAFTNALFEKTFEPLNIPSDRVLLSPTIEDLPDQQIPLHLWRLTRNNQQEEVQSLAAAIKNFFQASLSSVAYQVIDKESKQPRPLRPCDIAILCRTNGGRDRVAEALEASGIRVTIPRKGLLSSPECVLGFACLRYLVDKDDTLALAEILHYAESPCATPGWFQDWLKLKDSRSRPSGPIITELDELRSRLIHLTPTEAMEAALNAVKIYEAALKWGDGIHRLANIEKLRGLASHYEDQCLINRSAGTPAGLVTFLRQNIQGGEKDVQPEGQDENAVQILTYHGAKGLEWPMVIMYELDRSLTPWPFGAHVSSDQNTFDPTRPLDGRWIRYWPWPYGGYKTGVGLDDTAKRSPEYQEVSNQELKEAIRLLYVGMTRARDYLFFAVGVKAKKKEEDEDTDLTTWFDFLKGKDGNKLLSLPQGGGRQVLSIANEFFEIMVEKFDPTQSQVNIQPEQTYVTPTIYNCGAFPPARLVPSKMGGAITSAVLITNTVTLGGHIHLSGSPDMDLVGNAIHAFLAVDNDSWDDVRRQEMAKQILDNWKVTAITAESLVTVSNRLRSHIEQTYGKDCDWHKEWPISLRRENQKAKGWIDLLLETSSGFVIIDHKSFPGSMDKWEKKAIGYAPQLTLYREAVEKATGQSVIATMIHMPVLGTIIELKIDA
jgi:ATP-dependent exoDNAse (exonuclease V) beta subunit